MNKKKTKKKREIVLWKYFTMINIRLKRSEIETINFLKRRQNYLLRKKIRIKFKWDRLCL